MWWTQMQWSHRESQVQTTGVEQQKLQQTAEGKKKGEYHDYSREIKQIGDIWAVASPILCDLEMNVGTYVGGS